MLRGMLLSAPFNPEPLICMSSALWQRLWAHGRQRPSSSFAPARKQTAQRRRGQRSKVIVGRVDRGHRAGVRRRRAHEASRERSPLVPLCTLASVRAAGSGMAAARWWWCHPSPELPTRPPTVSHSVPRTPVPDSRIQPPAPRSRSSTQHVSTHTAVSAVRDPRRSWSRPIRDLYSFSTRMSMCKREIQMPRHSPRYTLTQRAARGPCSPW